MATCAHSVDIDDICQECNSHPKFWGTWKTVGFPSGTVILRCIGHNNMLADKPHLYIYYAGDIKPKLITDEESEKKRFQMADDLSDFLNGKASKPIWLEGLKFERSSSRFITNCIDGKISAYGPSVLPPDDNGQLDWQEDDSEQAEADRISLIDSLEVHEMSATEIN